MLSPLTDQDWDNLPADLRAVCLLRLLRRPVVRRWAHRVLGFPLSGPITRGAACRNRPSSAGSVTACSNSAEPPVGAA